MPSYKDKRMLKKTQEVSSSYQLQERVRWLGRVK